MIEQGDEASTAISRSIPCRRHFNQDDAMTHDYHRSAEAQREDDAEFSNEDRNPNVLPGAGMFWTAILALALIAAGAWMAFG